MSIQTVVCKSLKKLSGYMYMYYLYSGKRALFQNMSQGRRLPAVFSEEQRSSWVEWSLPKWLLPVKASSRKHQLTQVHFTWAKLFCLLQFPFLELIAQGYDGEDTKGHFSQGTERNRFYKMDGVKQGKALMNILCFRQLNKTHITKITINRLHEFKLLTKPYVLHYPMRCSPQGQRKALPNSALPITEQ